MGQPIVLSFSGDARPCWHRAHKLLTYVMVDFLRDRVMLGWDAVSTEGPRIYATRELVGVPAEPSPVLGWLSTAGQSLYDFLFECIVRAVEPMFRPLEMSLHQLPLPDAKQSGARPQLCMPISRQRFDGPDHLWPIITMDYPSEVPPELYLDGLVISQVLLDFQRAQLSVRAQKQVAGTYGDDSKTLLYETEELVWPDSALLAALESACSGGSFREELTAAILHAVPVAFGAERAVPAIGWPEGKSIIHAETLPAGVADLPAVEPSTWTVRDGQMVRTAADGKSWHLVSGDREIAGTAAELEAQRGVAEPVK